MTEFRYWSKTSKLDKGILGTALAVTIAEKNPKKLAFVGILRVSDDCANGLANDVVGQAAQTAIDQMKKYQVVVKVRKIAPCKKTEIANTLRDWSENLGLDLILTIGGTGVEPNDVTPEATKSVVEKEIQAINTFMIVFGLKLDPTSLLFRGVCGVRNKVLIINLPESLESSANCLNALLPNLPYFIGQLRHSQEPPSPTGHLFQSVSPSIAPSHVDSGISSGHHLPSHHSTDVTSFLSHRGVTPSHNHQSVTPSFSHHNVSPSLGHHDVTPPLGHHDVTASLGHHDVTASLGRHDVTASLGHHNVTSSADHRDVTTGHHNVTATIGHHSVTNSLGHHDATVLGHHDVATSLGHDVTTSLGHHAVPTSTDHHYATTSPPPHGVARSLSHHDVGDPAEFGSSTGLVTEEELLGGGTLEGLVASESLRIVGDRPYERGSSASDPKKMDLTKLARRPRSSPFRQVTVDKAYATVFAITNPMPVRDRFFKDAFDHVVAEDVKAEQSVPSLATAILDGYAVIAADTPGDLEVIPPPQNGVLTMGKTVRVTTGSPMPPGSDAVVPVEETVVVSEANNGDTEVMVRCLEPATPGQHVRPAGSDVASGQLVIKAGTKLGHLEVSMLASCGVSNVRIHPLPVVAVISFGEKLREPEEQNLAPGEIRDTNRMTFLLALKKHGFPTVDMGIVNKGKEQLAETIVKAYETADVILTTGGSAMGENDSVKPLLLELGATLHFARVIMKPGAPTAFASVETPRGKKIFFVLSGVPVPAYVAFNMFVLPCLRRLQGSRDPRSSVIQARLSTNVYLDAVPEFQRVSLHHVGKDPVPWAEITGRQIISRFLSMMTADALIILPAKSESRSVIKRGELVDAMLIV